MGSAASWSGSGGAEEGEGGDGEAVGEGEGAIVGDLFLTIGAAVWWMFRVSRKCWYET
jgi:hypothetical protein